MILPPQLIFANSTNVADDSFGNFGPINHNGFTYVSVLNRDTVTGAATLAIFKSLSTDLTTWAEVDAAGEPPILPNITGGTFGFRAPAGTVLTFGYASTAGNLSIAKFDLATELWTVVSTAGPAHNGISAIQVLSTGDVVFIYFTGASPVQCHCVIYSGGVWGAPFNVGISRTNQGLSGILLDSSDRVHLLRGWSASFFGFPTSLVADIIAGGAVTSSDVAVAVPNGGVGTIRPGTGASASYSGSYRVSDDTLRFPLQVDAPTQQAFILEGVGSAAPVWSFTPAWLNLYFITFAAALFLIDTGTDLWLFGVDTDNEGGTNYGQILYSKNGGAQVTFYSTFTTPLVPPSAFPDTMSALVASLDLAGNPQVVVGMDQTLPGIGDFGAVNYFIGTPAAPVVPPLAISLVFCGVIRYLVRDTSKAVA